MELLEKITFSSAKFEDFDEILKLLNEITQTINSQRNWENYRVDAKSIQQKEIFKEILGSECKIFVARYNNIIVGVINLQIVINLRHGWKRAHIEELVVKSEYRHKGVGSFMLKNIYDYCRKNNIRVIKLMCGNQLPIAQKFYEKNGFVSKDKGYRLEL